MITLPRFLWQNVRPFKGYFFGLLLTGIIWGLLLSYTPYMLKCIIDSVNQKHKPVTALVHDTYPYALLYLFFWLLQAIGFRVNDWLRLRLFPEVRRSIIDSMFRYVNRHSHQYFENQFAGSISNKISDMSGASVSLLIKVDEAFAQIVALCVATVVMLKVNFLFALILILWASSMLLVSGLFSKTAFAYSHVFSESKSKLSGKIVDSITNFKAVQSYARYDFENAHLKEVIDDTVQHDRRMQRYILKMRLAQDSTFMLLMSAMLLGLLYLFSKSMVTVGDFVLILSLSLSIFQAMWWLANQFVQFAEEIGRCTQALTLIKKSHDITDKANAGTLATSKASINFNNICFSYVPGTPVFDHLNLNIQANKSIGLVGYSGSGKSTLVNLLLRFYGVDSGEILINQDNIADITQDSLRDHIIFIAQDVNLFHRSLLENIRYGRIDATDEEVYEAAKNAYADSFIRQLPEGYDTLVGERGVKLSGGQRQRIAIARALLKKAPILILDEATSSLDSVTEAAIQNSLKTLIQDKTTIIIAHRLSTLTIVDEIVVMDKGRIIEQGSHDALIAKRGHYQKMWQKQSDGFLPEIDD